MFGEKFAMQVIDEINKIRVSPKSYSVKIKGYINYFKDNVLKLPNMNVGLMTQEGPNAYLEAAEFLLTLPKLQALTFDQGLTNAATEMSKEISKYEEFEHMNRINRNQILDKYGRYEGLFGESTDFGSSTPEMVVINLLVDDGNKQRTNRNMLFKEGYRKIGCGSCSHSKFKSVTVIMYATDFVKNTQKFSSGQNNINQEIKNEDYTSGYIKDIKPEKNIYTSGIQYRYINDVDPNKDLICDSANYDGPIGEMDKRNYLKQQQGGILNTNVESSGWTPTLQNSEYVKQREVAMKNDMANNQYRVKLPDSQKAKLGGGSILNTNIESSGWTPTLQRNYQPTQQEPEINVNLKNVKKTGGGILNTNIESSGWVTDFEKQKSPEYWKSKQEYQDNYKYNPNISNLNKGQGGGNIVNSNVESGDWNDYSGYDRRIPYYRVENELNNNNVQSMNQIKQQPINNQSYKDGEIPNMKGINRIEEFEKIVEENGLKYKLIKQVKYMDNGEVKTDIFKSKI